MEAITYPQHRLVWESDLDSAPLMMDSQLLKQVFLNLIKNAAEANSGRKATIRVLLRENPRKYVVEVIDDGPGIAAGGRPRVFEAYFTTKHTGPTPGMGLGLAICKKIVMDHQGEMHVESRPGKTCFQIHMPKAPLQGRGLEEQR
jgi:signal transduction histidine kinase